MGGCDQLHDPLIPVDDALARLLDTVVSLCDTQTINTHESLGRILAEPVVSTQSVPPADNSAMDGYAINSADTAEENCFAVSQRIPAGITGEALQPGTAARIFTGAVIPSGADTVIMQERVKVKDGLIHFSGPLQPGINIRCTGEDIAQDTVILEPGKVIRAQEMGLLASVGVSTLTVFRKLKVALFITGDELVEPGTALQPGQIYNSNRYTMMGLLQQLGCEIVELPMVPDNLEATINALKDAASKADFILSSGGVSVGEEDYVRMALESLGTLDMWRINIKPGKPVAYGHINDIPFIGLPGNPVSVFVTFCWLVSPCIKIMQGQSYEAPIPIQAAAGFEWSKAGPRREYARARITDNGGMASVTIYPHQGSGVLTSTSWANGLVEIPENQTIKTGDPVRFWYFEQLS